MKMKRLFRSVLACACLLVAGQAFAQTNASGTISASSTDCTTNSSCVVLQMPANGGGVALRITGTFSATLQFEASVGGNTFAAIAGGPLSGGSAVTSATSTGSWQFNTAGVASFRVRASAYVSGGAVIFIQSSAASPSGSTSVTGGTAVQVCASDLMTCAPVDGTLGLKVQASIDTTGLATSANQATLITNTTGLATAANQATQTTKLNGGLPAALGTGGGLKVDGSGTALPISAASLPLPSTAATSTKQSDGSQKSQIVDGSGNVIGATSNALDVNIKSGAGSGGTALADGGTFTAGSTNDTPVAGFYQASPTQCTTGKACAFGLTIDREVKVNIPALPADADIGATRTSNPAQVGGMFETSPATITDGKVAGFHFTNGQLLLISEPSPASRAVTNAGTFPVQLASLTTAIPDPCTTSAKHSYPISIASATTTVIAAASSSNTFRFCSMFLFASVAENVAVVEDATAACASPDAGIIGGTTTGAGINLAANQGWTLGNGLGTVAQTASTNVNVCLITSSSAQLSGVIMGVLAP